MVKNPPPNAGDLDPWVGKIPWRKEWLTTPVCLPGKFHGQRTPGYSSQGRKELDMTERLTHICIYSCMPTLGAPHCRTGAPEKENLYDPLVLKPAELIHGAPLSTLLSIKSFFLSLRSHSVVSDSLQPHGLFPTRLLPPWNSPGENIGQGSNPGLSHCRQTL